jgi:nucleoside-diphosphate-sugar epimerase
MTLRSSYTGKQVVVTGGLGFVGSNLVLRLTELGARVTVVDSKTPGCGANEYNIEAVRGQVRLIVRDVGEAAQFAGLLNRSEVIFNLAGEISHTHSMRFPERDGALNSAAQLAFLHQCARSAPGVRVVYAGTRQIYGKPRYLPVDEDHPIDPVDINGIHKHCAIQYHLTFSRLGLLDAVVLNLTNTYGPRMALDEPCQGFLATYIRRLIFGRPLEVFGDGCQLRDPLYVDDAVQGFLLAGAVARPPSRVYNLGGCAALQLREIAEIASEQAGGPAPVLRPFPAERKAIDIGSYYTDSSRIGRELGWRPAMPFAEGIGRTLAYYERELPHYLDRGNPDPCCGLLEREPAGLERYATR